MPRSVGGAGSRRPDLGGGAGRARSVSSRRSGRRATGAIPALLALLALALTGCTFQSGDPQDTITVASDLNEKIFSLYSLVFWLAMVVFIVVEILLIYSVIRFRRRPGDPLPPQMHGNNKLEVAWTIAPALLLVIVAIPTLRTMIETSQFEPAGPDVVQVRVVGWQFWWQIEYPELGVITANEIHVPVGKTVVFALETAAPDPDAPAGFQEGSPQHSFWIPQMGGKQDMLPTRTNYLSFTPRATGTFPGQCAELCGTSHANMRLRLVVHEQADFDAWVAQQRQQVTPPTDETLRRGQAAFGRCIACHTIQGIQEQGKVAPDLTHFGSRQTIAGVMDNTPDNLRLWIANPGAVKPGVKMPGFADQLRPQELDALVAYLESLK